MIQALIPTLAPILGKVVGNLFPDPEQKAKAEAEKKAKAEADKKAKAEAEQKAKSAVDALK